MWLRRIKSGCTFTGRTELTLALAFGDQAIRSDVGSSTAGSDVVSCNLHRFCLCMLGSGCRCSWGWAPQSTSPIAYLVMMMMLISRTDYVRPLLQLETVTTVLVICSDKQFSFQIMTERRYKMTAAYRCWKRVPNGRSCHGKAARTVSKRHCGWNSKITTCGKRT